MLGEYFRRDSRNRYSNNRSLAEYLYTSKVGPEGQRRGRRKNGERLGGAERLFSLFFEIQGMIWHRGSVSK